MTIKYLAILFTLLFSNYALRANIMHPTAKKIPHEFEIHGTKIQDDYAWLRADGWPENVTDKEVLSYLESENTYFKIYMSPFEKQKNMFFEELKGRIKLDDQSTYTKKDNFYYYNRTEADKNYSIYCRKKGSTEAKEEIILDVNKLAEGKDFTSLGAMSISPDHTLMAYSVDFTGGERYDIKIFNLETQEFLTDEVPNTIGSIVWHETIPGFFYAPTDEKWRHDKIKFHKLGTDVKDDKLIFHEKDPLYNVGAGKSASEDYIFIDINGHDSNELYYIDMKDESFTPKLFQKRKSQVFYSIDHDGEFFYKHTNDAAKNFHILRATSNGYSSSSDWQVYIEEKSDKYLSSFDLAQSYLLLNYKVMGLAENVVHDLKTGKEKNINFPDAAYTASIYSTNFEENDIRISYSSLARPSTVYEYDFSSGKLNILKVQEIPSGLNSDDYQVERVFAKSEDGTNVPISLFYKKSLFKKDGSNPLYLYGYGSYGIGTPPAFRSSAISLVDRGFVYAIAHIRGGDDLGHDWYEAAKFLTKKLTFSDFISCTEHLAHEKYTSAGNIVIMGGSAGGMLIGNVINQRPELFRAAIAHVPFVDVLNTMLDGDLPLTPGEYKEWGNPAEKKYFEYIKSYSPYDNVTAQNYPNIFVTAGLSDPRVGYWEAAKWVARLRDKKTDSNIILYKTNMSFGHQGASGRFDYLKDAAEELVFIMNMFNLSGEK
jgi:oligopeptidase B